MITNQTLAPIVAKGIVQFINCGNWSSLLITGETQIIHK